MIDGTEGSAGAGCAKRTGQWRVGDRSITKADGKPGQVGVGLGGVRINFRLDNPMDAATRGLFAAQVIWTLANADVAGPYVLEIDGEPLGRGSCRRLDTADVASTNPLATHECNRRTCMHCATVHW